MNIPVRTLRIWHRWLSSNIWVYIICLFAVTRILYMGFGVAAMNSLSPYMPQSMASLNTTISDKRAVQMWYVWDSVHYTRLAEAYDVSLHRIPPDTERNGRYQYHLLSWFPLYPLAGKVVHELTRLSIPFSLLLVSNVSLLAALYYFYRLVRIDHSENFARLAIGILLLLPTSFIFSSALSEGLFLLLAVLTMYFARSSMWLSAGLTGMLLALTRSVGFVICIPLAIEAIHQYGFPARTNWRTFVRPVIACALCGLGIALFMGYCWLRTGNALAYVDSQYVFWYVQFKDPLAYIAQTLSQLKTMVVAIEIGLLALFWRVIRPSLAAYGILFALAGVSIGIFSSGSCLRYIAVLFPVAIILTTLAERPRFAPYVWTTLGIIHGSLFILWVTWWTAYII